MFIYVLHRSRLLANEAFLGTHQYQNKKKSVTQWNTETVPARSPSSMEATASTASYADKKTSLIKPKANTIGSDCTWGAISGIILIKYQWWTGILILTAELRWDQWIWNPRVAHFCIAYREMAATAHPSFPWGRDSTASTPHKKMHVIPMQLQTLQTPFQNYSKSSNRISSACMWKFLPRCITSLFESHSQYCIKVI